MTKIYIIASFLAFTLSTNIGAGVSTKKQGGNWIEKSSAYQISVDSKSNREHAISLSHCDSTPSHKDLLSLIIDDSGNDDFSYMLLDSTRMVRMSSAVKNDENYIRLSPYRAGTYFLKVNEDNKTLMTFKIIKE